MALQVDVLAVAKNLFASTIMAVVLVAFQVVVYSKFLLPLYVLTGAVVYLILLRLLRAVDPADLRLLRGFLGPRLSPVSDMLSRVLLPKDQ